MSKAFSQGNQDGHEDGKTGDNHLAKRAFKRLFNPLSYAPGAENRDDEYRRGYLAGFEDEVRVKQVIPVDPANTGAAMLDNQGRGQILDDSRIEKPNQRNQENSGGALHTATDQIMQQTRANTAALLGANSTMAQTSYAHQIELLEELKKYLGDFQERLMGVSANYQRKVDALHSEGGLMDETYRDYVEQQLEPTLTLISKLVEHIEDNDIPAVLSEIAELERKI